LEGFGPSVAARLAALERLVPAIPMEEQDRERSLAFWRGIRDVSPFAGRPGTVWRLSVPPASGARVVATVREVLEGVEALYDWGGGLIWLLVDAPDAGHQAVRRAVAPTQGHATLIRAPQEVREAVPTFQPRPEALAALSRRVKDSFDPPGILNPGRTGL
jgi:glycolate oxidase FAD binding subunit